MGPATTGAELERIVSAHYNDLSTINKQIKEQKQMYKDAIANDAEYKDKAEQIKAAKKELKAIEKKIVNENDGVKAIMMKLKELSSSKKDTQLALFDYLDMYKKETQNGMIEINGELKRIIEVKKFKLIKDKA